LICVTIYFRELEDFVEQAKTLESTHGQPTFLEDFHVFWMGPKTLLFLDMTKGSYAIGCSSVMVRLGIINDEINKNKEKDEEENKIKKKKERKVPIHT